VRARNTQSRSPVAAAGGSTEQKISFPPRHARREKWPGAAKVIKRISFFLFVSRLIPRRATLKVTECALLPYIILIPFIAVHEVQGWSF